ncbi:hypothetical protein C8R44DRAFT_928271 [Mycena epipterygia]|nr:hypothetical protein C8R44DRAFT_928271 [Mycena epipterygia]
MVRQISPSSKTKIVEWRKARKPHHWIREHLKGHHTLSDRQINRIQNRYTEKENYYDVGKSTGRPRKLEPRDERKAVRHLANKSVNNATELQHDFFPDLSVKTVKRALRRNGGRGSYSSSRPIYLEREREETKTVGRSIFGLGGGGLKAHFVL